MLKAITCSKQTRISSLAISGSEDTCCPLSLMFVVLLVGILQGVEHPGFVYSIMPQWWHLMVLQYVAASFHLPSVSTANINTVQYPKPHSNMKYQQSQLLWYPRCCFLSPTSWQPLFTATAVSSTDVSSCLPKYNNHNITKLNFYSVQPLPADTLTLLPKMSNCQ